MVDVLLIDDETHFLRDFAEGLRLLSNRIQVVTADSAGKALEIMKTAKMDVVVTDLNMPGMDGYELMARLQELRPYVPVIIVSAYTKASVESQLRGLRFVQYVEKPVDLDQMVETILAAA